MVVAWQRVSKLLLGYLWALSMMLAGLWFWTHPFTGLYLFRFSRCVAVMTLAGAIFIFMAVVVDDLCPKAHVIFTGFVKSFAGFLVWWTFAAALYFGWRAVLG